AGAGMTRTAVDVATSPLLRPRRRALGLTLAVVALLACGAATAAFMRFGRPAARAGHPQTATADLHAPAQRPAPTPDVKPQPVVEERNEPVRREEIARTARTGMNDVVSAPPVPRMPRNIRLTVPAGTEIHLTLDSQVASSTRRP